MCRRPFVEVNAAYSCGQCLPCRINRRRVWSHRMMLELTKWEEAAFITLTYTDTYLPVLSAIGEPVVATLVPKHLQDFLKRLRWVLRPARFSYYAVGEYGREGERADTWNPHYHIILYGVRTCERGDSSLSPFRACRCVSCVLLGRAWPFGRVHLGTVEDKSIQYVAGYIVEKLRSEVRGDLGKRHPEFARMSLRPAIGVRAMSDVAALVDRYGLAQFTDVPSALRHGKRMLPLGRTLVRRLRVEIGRDPSAPCVVPGERDEKMRSMRVRALKDEVSFRSLVIEEDAEKVRQLTARLKLRERGKR